MQSSTRQLFHQTIRSEAENKLDVVGLSVTEHVDRIQNWLDSMRYELDQDNQQLCGLNKQLKMIETIHTQNIDQFQQMGLNTIKQSLHHKFRRNHQELQSQQNNISQQTVLLIQDDQLLEKKKDQLNQRVVKCESHLGFKHVYDRMSIQPSIHNQELF